MLFAFAAAPAMAATKVPSTVRVVTTSGKILVDKKLTTGTTTVKSSASAGCFGAVTGWPARSAISACRPERTSNRCWALNI